MIAIAALDREIALLNADYGVPINGGADPASVLEGVLQTKSRGVVGAKTVHAARANLRSMSLLIAP